MTTNFDSYLAEQMKDPTFAVRVESEERKAELAQRVQNRMRTADAIASEMQKIAPEALPFTHKVGAWLWIEFPTKPEPKTLEAVKALGFSWNLRRLAWQNPCGVFRRRNPKIDPREVYGEEPVLA